MKIYYVYWACIETYLQQDWIDSISSTAYMAYSETKNMLEELGLADMINIPYPIQDATMLNQIPWWVHSKKSIMNHVSLLT